MADLDVRLLGGFEVRGRAGRSIVFPTRKARALVARLARHPGRPQAREALAAMLWPDSAESEARGNLRQALKQVRKALGGRRKATIVGEGDALVLEPDAAEVDVDVFERLHEEGAQEALERAASLYRGDFLEGVNLADGPFADWSAVERMRLYEQAIHVFSRLLADRMEVGRTEPAIETALRLLALDPLQEHVHRHLMQLYAAEGRRGAALEQYRLCRATLERELGVRPEHETEQLHQEIRRGRRLARRPAPIARSSTSRATAPLPTQTVDTILERPAVAVLPFTELSGDPAQVYFADGLSEDIITALAGWRCFPLIASASTFNYRAGETNPRSTATELGARYLVGGSVRRSGAKLRISAHLIEADSAHYLWRERFDLDLHDVLAAQEEAAQKIAAVVEPELEQVELNKIVTKRTEDWSAWDHYLRGWSLLKRYTAEDDGRARSEFDRALSVDAHYGDALTGLAQSHLQDIALGAGDPREKSLERALDAAREAAKLDPQSSSAHLVLGHACVWAEEYESAIVETQHAVKLNPSNALARGSLGNRLDLIGYSAEGIVQMEHALRLNPRDPRRFRFMGFLARAYAAQDERETALIWARKAVQLRPDLADLHFRLAICFGNLDRVDEARAALDEAERLSPGFHERHKGWQPYTDSVRNERFYAGLRRHGLIV